MEFINVIARNKKIIKTELFNQNKENHEIHKVLDRITKNHENLIITLQNHENHEIYKMQCQNNKKH